MLIWEIPAIGVRIGEDTIWNEEMRRSRIGDRYSKVSGGIWSSLRSMVVRLNRKLLGVI
jgi:hypothetical protein